jgi:hypothetical protein
VLGSEGVAPGDKRDPRCVQRMVKSW